MFGNSVVNFLNSDANGCSVVKAYVEIAPCDGNTHLTPKGFFFEDEVWIAIDTIATIDENY